jgi:hypothetical protein
MALRRHRNNGTASGRLCSRVISFVSDRHVGPHGLCGGEAGAARLLKAVD